MDPSASTVYARCGPHSVPVGRFGLPADTATVTSSRPIPRAASAFGSTWIRTAYLPDPNTCTCAPPLTVDKRCARNVSAYSSNTDSGRVPDVKARYRIGASDGFDLLYDGGRMAGGRPTGGGGYDIARTWGIPTARAGAAPGREETAPRTLFRVPPPTRGLRSRTAADVDLGVRRETQLTIDHHQGARRHARNDGETVQRAFHRHRLRRGGAVVVDDEHVCALLTLHDRLTGHDDGVILNAQNECDGDVLAGPERAVAIGKAGLQQHGAGGRVDLVVDKGKDAVQGRRRIARRQGDHCELLTGALAQRRQARRRHREAHEHGAQLHNRDERVTARTHEIAFPQEQPSRASADGRAHGRVLEIETSNRGRRGVGADGCSGRVGGRLPCLVVFLGHRVGCRQRLIARRFTRRACRGGHVAEQRAFRLLQGGTVWTGIDLEQDLSGGDLVALGEVNVQDRAVDLRQDIDRVNRLDCPRGIQLVGQRATFNPRDGDGNLRSRACAARATRSRCRERPHEPRAQTSSKSHDLYTHILLKASFRPARRVFEYAPDTAKRSLGDARPRPLGCRPGD